MIHHSVRPSRYHRTTVGETYGVPPSQLDLEIKDGDPHFNLKLMFGDEVCGQLIYEDNRLKFTGSFETSGRIFAEFLGHKFKEWHVTQR